MDNQLLYIDIFGNKVFPGDLVGRTGLVGRLFRSWWLSFNGYAESMEADPRGRRRLRIRNSPLFSKLELTQLVNPLKYAKIDPDSGAFEGKTTLESSGIVHTIPETSTTLPSNEGSDTQEKRMEYHPVGVVCPICTDPRALFGCVHYTAPCPICKTEMGPIAIDICMCPKCGHVEVMEKGL